MPFPTGGEQGHGAVRSVQMPRRRAPAGHVGVAGEANARGAAGPSQKV